MSFTSGGGVSPGYPGLQLKTQSIGDGSVRVAKAAVQRNRRTFSQIYPGDTRHLGFHHQELQSILREGNPQQFQQELKVWAVNLVQGQELQVAGAVLGYLAQEGLTPKLKEEGAQWLAAAQGGGPAQYQVGLLANNLQSQIYDYPMLFGMGAAGFAYKLGKWGAMAASYGRWGKSVGGLGLEAGSSLVGFAIEVPTFTAATKGAQMTLGQEAHWDHFWPEMRSGAWLLGSLKMTGALSKKAIGLIHGIPRGAATPTRFASWYAGTSKAVPQFGMLVGVMGGHEMAARAEGTPRPYGFLSWGNLREGLVTLIHFNAAGKALPLVMRRSHALGEKLEQHTNMLRRFPDAVYPKGDGPTSEFQLDPTLAMAATGSGFKSPARDPKMFLAMMDSREPTGSGKAPMKSSPMEAWIATTKETHLWEKLPPKLREKLEQGKFETWKQLIGFFRPTLDRAPEEYEASKTYLRLLWDAQLYLTGAAPLRKSGFPKRNALESALRHRLEQALAEEPDYLSHYLGILGDLEKKPGKDFLLAILLHRVLTHSEEGLDLLDQVGQINSTLKKHQPKLLFQNSESLLGFYLKYPQVMHRLFEIMAHNFGDSAQWQQWGQSFLRNPTPQLRVMEDLMVDYPEVAPGILENWFRMAAGETWKQDWPSQFQNFLYDLGSLPEGRRREILGAMINPLNHLFGNPGGKLTANKRAQIEIYVRLLPFYLLLPNHLNETTSLVIDFVNHDSEGHLRHLESFWQIYETAGLPPERFLGDWQRLQRGDDFQKTSKLVSDFQSTEALLPEKPAAQMVLHPDYIAGIEKGGKDAPTVDLHSLVEINLDPKYHDYFVRFLEKTWTGQDLSHPNRYLASFALLSILSLEGRGPKDSSDPYWDEILPEKISPKEKQTFLRVYEEILVENSTTPQELKTPSLNEWNQVIYSAKDLAELLERKSAARIDRELGDSECRELHQEILDNLQFLASLSEEGRQSQAARQLANHVVASLNHLPPRPVLDRIFQRTEMVLRITQGIPFPPEEAPSLLPALEADLMEMATSRADERGDDLARLTLRLAGNQHPQWVQLAEKMMGWMTNPYEQRGFRNLIKKEEASALETMHYFLTPEVERVLTAAPLSEAGRKTFHKIQTVVKHYRKSQRPLEDFYLLREIHALFFAGPEEGPLGEAPDLEASQLVLPKNPSETPALAEAPSKETKMGEDSPPTQALVRALSGQALTTTRLSPNPKTGLMELDLGGGRKMALWHAVAPIRNTDAGEARSDWHERSWGSLEKARGELGKLDREHSEGSAALVPRPQSDALELADRLAAIREADSVQLMMRTKLGKDPEGEILDKIVKAVNLRQGLDMLEMALQTPEGIRDMKALAQHLPNITSWEVALMSLVEKVPALLLNPHEVARPHRFLIKAIEWASQYFDPDLHRQSLYTVDPYEYLGVTGERTTTEHNYFLTRISKLIQTALKTQMRDRTVFQGLWSNHPEAAKAGLKMLREQSDPRRLLNKVVVDVDANLEIPPSQVARLIGLLEKIPTVFVSEEAARIYFKPFAGGVLFLDGEAKPLDFVPYHPYLQKEGMEDFFYKTEEKGGADETFAHQFLGTKFSDAIYRAALEESGGEISLLEETVANFESRFEIGIPVTARPTARPAVLERADPIEGESLKMGTFELAFLGDTLSTIPQEILARARDGVEDSGGIRIIRKEHSDAIDFVDWSRDTGTLGYYQAHKKSITLKQFRGIPFIELDDLGMQIYEETILHEFGEAYFETLTPRQIRNFIAIYPWQTTGVAANRGILIPSSYVQEIVQQGQYQGTLTPKFSNEELPKHLLTSYSSSNPRDLFCEAFMAYMRHGPEFRKKAEDSPYLQKLYAFMRDQVFTTREDRHEFDVEPEFSLSQIEENIHRWKVEEHKKREEFTLKEAHQEALDNTFGKFILSVETAQENAVERGHEEHIQELRDSGNYVAAYYEMAGRDEAGRSSRGLYQRSSSTVTPSNWELDVENFLVEALEKEVFLGLVREIETREAILGERRHELEKENDFDPEEEDYDPESDHEHYWPEPDPMDPHDYQGALHGKMMADAQEQSTPQLIQGMAQGVWEALKMGKRDRALAVIREKISQARDLSSEMETDEGEILNLLIAVAQEKILELVPAAKDVHQELSEVVLPGQYAPKDLENLSKIFDNQETTDIETIHAGYQYINKRWKASLSADQRLTLAANLGSRFIQVGIDMGSKKLKKLILALDDDSKNIYEIAEKLELHPGEIDAFAEKFLDAKSYQDLLKRSERDQYLYNLNLSLVIHKSLLQQFQGMRPDEKIPEFLSDGIARLEGAIALSKQNQAEFMELAPTLLSDQAQSAKIDELAREVFQQGDEE